ncbi:MAG: serine hydrolase, partial [Ilumatobacter sp.]|uniref:serine hydrolase domain-containing protein n=1 Tax=Ilumatobacter sp. TaxID=1967498 RepID=UPI0032996C12
GVALAACSNDADDNDATAAPSTAGSTAHGTTSTASTSTTAVPSTSVAATPWAGADFGELDDFISSTNGTGFAVVEAGVLVHEWYRDEPDARRDIASAQKSMLSLLVGRAVVDGHFTVDTTIDELIGTGWTSHGDTAGITVRNLLTMTSGLDDRLEVVAAPDSVWLYSGAFAVLFDVLVATTGRELGDLADDWLFGPAGADTAEFYERRSSAFAPIGMVASINDLTSIGTWVLDQFDEQADQPFGEWLRSSFAADQDLNASYGSLWWLNGKDSFVLPGPDGRTRPGPLIPSAPTDMVAALGKDDQKMYVSPALSLVVARVGDRAVPRGRQALSSFDDQLWSMLSRLRG